MRTGLASLLILHIAVALYADDAWFLRMNGNGAPIDRCSFEHWTDDVLFFNNGSDDAELRILDATYPVSAGTIRIAAGRSTTLNERFSVALQPSASTAIGVLHADVPHDVAIMSRMLLFASQTQPILPPGCPVPAPPIYGASPFATTPLPIRRTLVPPNQRQVHLGADLAGIEGRMSAVIFNGSDVAANATVNLLRGCDDVVLDTRAVTVPAHSVVQLFGFSTAIDHVCAPGNEAALRRTMVITVDQPSLSWVTATQQFPFGAPQIGASIVY